MSTALRDLTPREHPHHRWHATASDAALLARVRDGDDEAYAALYARHLEAAERLARQLCRSSAAADDLVGDAFAAILAALRNGAGPTEAFRPYLLTTVRNRSYRRGRTPEDPVDPQEGTGTLDGAVFDDDGDDQRLMVEAYRSLPERWQLVLWHTEIEGQRPAEVAPLVGLSPHATAALAHRAREGLREAYLQAHLKADTPPGCAFTVAHLGALVRGNLGARDRTKVDGHLTGCSRCQHLRSELLGVNRALRSIVAPIVLGSATAAYLARRGAASPSTTMVEATRSAGGGSLRRAAGVAAALGLALGFLVLRSDHPRTTPEAAPRQTPAAAAAAAARPPAGDDPSAGGTGVDLPGGVTVHRVATTDCVDRYGVALVGAATASSGAAERAGATVVTASLVRDGSGPLNALGVAVDDAVTAVTGPALTTLRTLTASVAPTSTATVGGAGTGAGGSGTCLTVSAPTLLAPSGSWGLLVTYLPAGATTLADLRAAVLAQPFAFLGDTTRAAVHRARNDAADVLAALPSAANLSGDVGDQFADLLGPVATTGGPTGASGAPGDPTGSLTGGLGGAVGADPAPTSTLLPPVSVPGLPLPTVTLPSLPIPGLP